MNVVEVNVIGCLCIGIISNISTSLQFYIFKFSNFQIISLAHQHIRSSPQLLLQYFHTAHHQLYPVVQTFRQLLFRIIQYNGC